MRRIRFAAVPGIVLLVLLVLAPPAFAPWKGLSDLNYDDGGNVCRDGIDFALTNIFPSTLSVEVSNVSVDPNVVIVPSTLLQQLEFGPVPELFGLGDYYYSSSARVRFGQELPAGTQVVLRFSGGVNTSTGPQTVQDCLLGRKVSGFIGLKDPPGVNTVPTSGPIWLVFRVPGSQGLDIFTEPPTFAPIPCAPAQGVNPGYLPSSATGLLKHVKALDLYLYRWDRPVGVTGCQEVWFRLKKDGLQHRVMFDFGT
jgi:hypothetical protein